MNMEFILKQDYTEDAIEEAKIAEMLSYNEGQDELAKAYGYTVDLLHYKLEAEKKEQ